MVWVKKMLSDRHCNKSIAKH